MSRSSLLAIACTMLLALGCEEVPVVTPQPSAPTGGLGGAQGQGGAGGHGAADASTTGPGGASVAPLWLGVRANVATSAPPALADLRAYAAGVRLAPIEVPFDDLDEAALAQKIADHAAQQVRVVVTLLVVDGQRSHRPPGLEQTAWNDPLMKLALLDAIDAIDGAGTVEAIAVGRRVDHFLAAFPAEGEALAELLAHGLGEATTAAPLGVGLGHASGELPPLVASLASLGAVSVRSYLPGLGRGSVQPASVAMDLDALAAIAAQRPVLLADVAFPSASAIGASEEMQSQALHAFFAALEPRRARFPWVVVHQLHDLDEAACAALALEQGEEPSGPWSSHACSTGLRTPEDEPKEAWSRFLEATARFASP